MPCRCRSADEVQHSRCGVDQAHHLAAADLAGDQTRRGNQQWHVNILFVKLKRMAVIAVVLAERLSMIAEDNPEPPFTKTPGGYAVDQRAERRVSVVERVPIASEGVAIRKGPGLRRLVRMMPRDRQVCDEETLPRRQHIDPLKNSRDGRRLVDAETGMLISADIAGVGQRIEAAMADHRLHTEISEA